MVINDTTKYSNWILKHWIKLWTGSSCDMSWWLNQLKTIWNKLNQLSNIWINGTNTLNSWSASHLDSSQAPHSEPTWGSHISREMLYSVYITSYIVTGEYTQKVEPVQEIKRSYSKFLSWNSHVLCPLGKHCILYFIVHSEQNDTSSWAFSFMSYHGSVS